jgi:hypothetical protein
MDSERAAHPTPAAEKYTPQLQHNMWVVAAKSASSRYSLCTMAVHMSHGRIM